MNSLTMFIVTIALLLICNKVYSNNSSTNFTNGFKELDIEEEEEERYVRKTTLYPEGNFVVNVNATNFNSIIYGKPNAWFIEFYHIWCAYCVSFVPTIIATATATKGWSGMIKIAAMNCADGNNTQTCRDFSATRFPTIKSFKVNASEGDYGEQIYPVRTIDGIQEGMVDFILSPNINGPPSWPIFEPIDYLDMDSLWHDRHIANNHSHVALLVLQHTYLPHYITLDLLPMTLYINVFYVLEDSPLLKTLEGNNDIRAPALIIIDRQGIYKLFTNCDDIRDCYVKHVENFVIYNLAFNRGNSLSSIIPSNKVEKIKPDPIIETISDKKEANNEIKSDNIDLDGVYLQDLENVLVYILTQEVTLNKQLIDEKLDALKTFLDIIVKYLPCRETVKKFLTELLVWINSKTSFTFEEYEEKIADIQKLWSLKFQMQQWMGCRGSEPQFRQYPCGLWITFHTLTVNAYLQHKKDPKFNPLEVIMAIRKYMINFFGCSNCVYHFTKMSNNISKEIVNHDDSVLWLWHAHNKVNARLKGQTSEDPKHPKRQFPTMTMCKDCHHNKDQDKWNQSAVLDFLVKHYSDSRISIGWQLELVSIPSITNVEAHGHVQLNRSLTPSKSRFTNEIAHADVNILFALYLPSILVLFSCYLFVISRRCCRPCWFPSIHRKRLNPV